MLQYAEFRIAKMMSAKDYLYYSDHCAGLFPNRASLEADVHERLAQGNPVYDSLKIVAGSALGALSAIAAASVAAIILSHKRLSGPHNKLIAFLCILTACSSWHLVLFVIGTSDFSCYFGTAQLLHQTLQPIAPDFTLLDAVKTLDFANAYAYDLCQFLAQCLGICICYDLAASITAPFQPPGRRMKQYYGGTLILFLIFFPGSKSMLHDPNDFFDQYILPWTYLDADYSKYFARKGPESVADTMAEAVEVGTKAGFIARRFEGVEEKDSADLASVCKDAAFLLLFMIVAACSMGFSSRLQAKAHDGSAMKFHLANHLSFLAVLVAVWSVFLANNYYVMYVHSRIELDPLDTYVPEAELRERIAAASRQRVVFAFCLLISLLQGLAIAIVRTTEPVYRFILKREALSWFGILAEQPPAENDIRVNSAHSLMNAERSLDLVWAILYTVTENTVGVRKSKNWQIYQKYDFMNKNDFLIESMVVQNIDALRVTELPEDLVASNKQINRDASQKKSGKSRSSQSNVRAATGADSDSFAYVGAEKESQPKLQNKT